MGIPLWREPSESDDSKSAVEKDSSAAARSAIRRQASLRRPSRHTARARGVGGLSAFHSQILDEIQRGIAEPQMGVRSPVLNLGISEDGLDLDASRREALGRNTARPQPSRDADHLARRARTAREQALLSDILSRADRRPSPSFTPNFAPAVAYRTATSARLPSDGVRLPPLPPLRRTSTLNHDSPTYIPSFILRDYRNDNTPGRSNEDPPIDGLGDRQRSVSPDGERENDAWETLLSTLTPDAHLPSTSTSFFSTTGPTTDASHNSTSRTSTASSQTLPPVHMALDPYPDQLHPCDLSSSEDEDTPVNYHRIAGPSGLPIALRRSPGLPSTLSNHPPIPTISFSFSDSSDTDLQQMQAILDRLARREDIPDDWWAGAGLSRNLGRGLSTGTNPRANDNEGTD
ncbi:hypothetical protein N7466_004310 [Penicillium verhagenii]|uniref:uncharacterized protein n=1 Tax=Penicillium verhagenii TaxID=1562060 RepID=UPI0025450CB2|nr:uncharacterized protein N7466_004310 [Penicillium verhagenii]KAJ5934763.1 hypothetical protein N7466_004310 [Penicillium verhagenii]